MVEVMMVEGNDGGKRRILYLEIQFVGGNIKVRRTKCCGNQAETYDIADSKQNPSSRADTIALSFER